MPIPRRGQSTESPSTSPAHDAELSPDDDEALAMLGPPTLARLTTDEQYGPFYGTKAMVGGDQMEPGAYAMSTEQQTGMPLDNMVQSQAVAPTEMMREAPRPMEPMQYQETMQGAPVSPTGQQQPMMYTEAMMQQAMQNVVQQAMQQQQRQMQELPNGQQIQYVPVPTPMPVQMMPQMMPQMV